MTDLFGDPVLPRREGRGRPPHVWSRSNSNRVLLAFARGLGPKAAATAIGISVPTLYKVYFNECEKRQQAQLRTEMMLLEQLAVKAEAGDTSAIKELFTRLDKLRTRDSAKAMAGPAPKAEKLGKKAEAERRALEQKGLYEPPAPPQLN